MGGVFIAIKFSWQVCPPHRSSLGRVMAALVVSKIGLTIEKVRAAVVSLPATYKTVCALIVGELNEKVLVISFSEPASTYFMP